METINNLEYNIISPSVVALGCFDGVHIGHSKVIEKAVEIAKENSLCPVVWSFEEPPRKFYAPQSVKLLATTPEKEELISSFGVEILISIKFDEAIARVSAEDFFNEYLVRRLSASHIVCGHNFTFGYKGLGNVELLKKLCEKNFVGLTVIPAVTLGKNVISSSYIRELLSKGKTEEASGYLGRYYSITHTVIQGQQLGRNLGFPTINQKIKPEYDVLAYGVYLTRIFVENDICFGITNIGCRPTVDGQGVVAETNIFDFSGDLYGKKIKIEFLEFLRNEKKFSSIDELSKSVHRDIEKAKLLCEKYKQMW